jgi:AcrR family transcriptional regulator
MTRRTGEQTKALLLRVGMQMLIEQGVSAGVQHIRLQDVLRRAGLTTGAAYRLWGDQTDYQRDLAVAMVRLRVSSPTETARAAVEGLIASGAEGDEVIRAAAETHVRATMQRESDPTAVLDSRAFLIALALRTTAETWPELREASIERHRESIDAFADFYRQLMAAYGLRMREPLTLQDFTQAMAAAGEGFAVRALEGVEHPTYEIPGDAEVPAGSWTLFGLTVRALVREFMIREDGSPI